MHLVLCRVALPALIAALVPVAASAQDAAAFYEENCAVCHTIGGGDQAGPDLKGMSDRKDRQWLVRFLLDPEGVVKSGDAYATKMVAQWNDLIMPAADGMTPAMAEALIDYIDQQSRQAGAAPLPAALVFTDADRTQGLDIFMGRRRLANSGPSCVSCHRLGGYGHSSGGLLGPDLAAVHTRLGGARGTTAWLSRPPTPMMRAIYQRAAFTEDESRSLAALFEAATAAPADAATERRWLLVSGLGLAMAGLAAIGLTWRGRFRSVRRRLLSKVTSEGEPAH